jgi:hypothetical protein
LSALLTIAGPAQALVVSKDVGPLLQQAMEQIQAKNYKAATAKLNEAEAVKATPDDETVIQQMRQAIVTFSDPTRSDPTKPHCDSAMGTTRCDGRAIGSQH